MLRIHVEEQCESVTIRLEGSLAGAWVAELERCWRKVRPWLKNRGLVVELDAVTFVDAPGHSLLVEMHSTGATLVARGVLSRYVVEQIQQRQIG
jgi:translation initiation factor 2 gamma subunit (eIF-2gamma)